jgi:hypothetical protein
MIPHSSTNPKFGKTEPQLRRFAATIQPGQAEYRIVHGLGSEDVIVQTRIAGRIREGGISILDANTVQILFGGVLHEAMRVVVIG